MTNPGRDTSRRRAGDIDDYATAMGSLRLHSRLLVEDTHSLPSAATAYCMKRGKADRRDLLPDAEDSGKA